METPNISIRQKLLDFIENFVDYCHVVDENAQEDIEDSFLDVTALLKKLSVMPIVAITGVIDEIQCASVLRKENKVAQTK